MITGCAKRSLQGTMHIQNPRCTCRFMQPVYVLRDDHHLAFCFTLQSGKGLMCRVRLGLHGLRPPCVIEIMDELWIAREAFGCGYILDPVLGPQAPFIAKGTQTTLSGNSGSCQNDYLFHDPSLAYVFLPKGDRDDHPNPVRLPWQYLPIPRRRGCIPRPCPRGSDGQCGHRELACRRSTLCANATRGQSAWLGHIRPPRPSVPCRRFRGV